MISGKSCSAKSTRRSTCRTMSPCCLAWRRCPSSGLRSTRPTKARRVWRNWSSRWPRDRPYAMAFVDVRMPPGWDGVETITHLWKAYPHLQTVICTAYSDYSWTDIQRRLGHSDNLLILKKPFDNIEVIQLAHTLTRKWLLSRQVEAKMADLDLMVAERTAQLRNGARTDRTRVSTESQSPGGVPHHIPGQHHRHCAARHEWPLRGRQSRF